jgi:hypothetical protein
MEELVEVLCKSEIDEGLVAIASMTWSDANPSSEEHEDPVYKMKRNLLYDLQNCVRYYLCRDPSFFWDKYNSGVYGENWDPQYRDYVN